MIKRINQSIFPFEGGNFDVSHARKSLRENGWVLVKGVFSPQEVVDLREKAYASSQDGFASHDLLSNPHLRSLVGENRVVQLMQTLLQGSPVYFGDSGYQIASEFGRISHGFHKDCVDAMHRTGRIGRAHTRFCVAAFTCRITNIIHVYHTHDHNECDHGA